MKLFLITVVCLLSPVVTSAFDKNVKVQTGENKEVGTIIFDRIFNNQTIQINAVVGVGMGAETILTGHGVLAVVTWSTACPGSEGTGTFNSLEFEGCISKDECNVRLDKSYNIILRYTPGQLENSIKATLSVTPQTPANSPSQQLVSGFIENPPFSPNIQRGVQHGVVFGTGNFNGKIGTIYNLEMKLESEANDIIVCRNFLVTLSSKKDNNDGSSIGASCNNLYESCAFENSLCLPEGSGSTQKKTCKCDYSSYDEGTDRGCKKIIGTYCESKEECIRNALCVKESQAVNYGFCNCSTTADPVKVCNNSSNSVLVATVVLVAFQFMVFFHNSKF